MALPRRLFRLDLYLHILLLLLFQWSNGDDLPSTSWREYYQNNPCVPVDYPTLHAALASVEAPDSNNPRIIQQTRSIRVLLRPGDHVLREAIIIQALEGVQVTIETMKGGPFLATHEISDVDRAVENTPSSLSPTRRLARKAANMRNRMTCRSIDDDDVELEHPPVERLSPRRSEEDFATLILRTRRHNEPLFRVRQGTCKLVNLQLLHNCHGMDIWNGNAAIQIQPPVVPQGEIERAKQHRVSFVIYAWPVPSVVIVWIATFMFSLHVYDSRNHSFFHSSTSSLCRFRKCCPSNNVSEID